MVLVLGILMKGHLERSTPLREFSLYMKEPYCKIPVQLSPSEFPQGQLTGSSFTPFRIQERISRLIVQTDRLQSILVTCTAAREHKAVCIPRSDSYVYAHYLKHTPTKPHLHNRTAYNSWKLT